MKKLSDILPTVLNRYGLNKSARSSLVIEYFKQFFELIWSKDEYKQINSVIFRKACLVVRVKNSAWANQIYMRKNEIIEYLKDNIDNLKIEELVVKID